MNNSIELVCDKEKDVAGEGRYLYCVVEIDRKKTFKKFGVDEKDVYTIPYQGISAVVHPCPPRPYQSDDRELVKKWLLQHQEVVNFFFERYDAVLPLAFDTIIKASDIDPDEKVRNWLKEEYSNLRRKMEKIKGKQEFGVQILWDSKSIADELRNESIEIRKMLNEIASKPRGLAYIHEQKLKNVLKKELEDKAEKYSQEFYCIIRSDVDDVRIEKISNVDGDRQMIMNLSCLIRRSRVQELGRELDRINSIPHISVKFTGPWPAYSFMT